MPHAALTVRDIIARPIVLKLKRPIVARIATISDWPLILIDLVTEEGVVGRSYLEPYIIKSMRYLVPALHDLAAMLRGRHVAPIELFEAARKSLHFVGYEGLSRLQPLASIWRPGMRSRRPRIFRSACCSGARSGP
jgi:mandelate racemase